MRILPTVALLLLTTGTVQSQLTDLPPTTPTDLVADAYSQMVGEIRWARSTDDRGALRGYEITRDNIVLGEFDALSYVDRTLSPGITYQYGITAIDNSGQRSGTATISLTTPGMTDIPEAPADLRASVYSKTAAELFWTRSSQFALRYEVSRNGVQLATTDGISFFDNDLASGQTYNYVVVSINANGQRSTASTVSVETPGDNTPGTGPEAPAGLNALVYSSTAAELFWTRASSTGLRYEISRDGQLIDTTDGTSYFDNTLESGREYIYDVVAINNSGGTSPPSNVTLRTNGNRSGNNPFADPNPNATTVLARTGYPAIRMQVDDLVSMNYLTLFYDIATPTDALLRNRISDTEITIECPGGGSATGTASPFNYDFILDRCVIEGRILTGGLAYDAEFIVFGAGGSQRVTLLFNNLRIESSELGTATFVGQSERFDSRVANIDCSGAPRVTRTTNNQFETVELETDGESSSVTSATWQQSWIRSLQRTNPDVTAPCTRIEQLSFTGSAEVLSSRFAPEVTTEIDKQGQIVRDETETDSSASANLAANFNDGSQFAITFLSDSNGEVQVDIMAEDVAASFVENFRFEARQDIPSILGD